MTKSSTTRQRRLLDINQAAEFYSCSTKTIRRMIARGEIKAVRVGPRMIRIDVRDLEAEALLRPIPTTGPAA